MVFYDFDSVESKEKLEQDRQGLQEFIDKFKDIGKLSKKAIQEIISDDNKRLDELHIKFVCKNNIVDTEELNLVRKVFDFLKSN